MESYLISLEGLNVERLDIIGTTQPAQNKIMCQPKK